MSAHQEHLFPTEESKKQKRRRLENKESRKRQERRVCRTQRINATWHSRQRKRDGHQPSPASVGRLGAIEDLRRWKRRCPLAGIEVQPTTRTRRQLRNPTPRFPKRRKTKRQDEENKKKEIPLANVWVQPTMTDSVGRVEGSLRSRRRGAPRGTMTGRPDEVQPSSTSADVELKAVQGKSRAGIVAPEPSAEGPNHSVAATATGQMAVRRRQG